MDNPHKINTFLDAPLEVGIDEAAMLEFERYCSDYQLEPDQAMGRITDDHMSHVRESVALHKSFTQSSVGGAFVTNVAGYDLSVLDVMLPMIEQRRVVLLTTFNGAIEKSAQLVEQVRAAGLSAEEKTTDGEKPILQ